MRALLDVNVLVAMLDAAHVHHALAAAWLDKHLGRGWASCPSTQNGCLRILSSPGYPSPLPLPLARLVERLHEAVAVASHAFWPDSVGLLDAKRVGWRHVLGGRQLTDAYLLALAVDRGGCLVTFDRGVALAGVAGAQARHLVTLT